MTSMLSKDSKSGSQFGVTVVTVRRSSVSPLLMLKREIGPLFSCALPTPAEPSVGYRHTVDACLQASRQAPSP